MVSATIKGNGAFFNFNFLAVALNGWVSQYAGILEPAYLTPFFVIMTTIYSIFLFLLFLIRIIYSIYLYIKTPDIFLFLNLSTILARKIARYTFTFRTILTLLGLVSTSFWLLAMCDIAYEGMASPLSYIIESITKLINYSYAGLLVTLGALNLIIEGNFFYSGSALIVANENILPDSIGLIEGGTSESLDISLRPGSQDPLTLTHTCGPLRPICEGDGGIEGESDGVDGAGNISITNSPE